MTAFEKFHPFLISLVISLIVGIERERSHARDSQAVGVRTFMLLGLSGTLAAFLESVPLTAGFMLFACVLVLLGYWRTSGPNRDTGLTTEVSAILMFGLGFLAYREPALALALGFAVFGILFSRSWLHTFSRDTLTPNELQAILTIGVLLVGVVPFLPDRAIDPWEIFNPRRLMGVISALALIQFASYIAVRILGSKAGLLLSGFLGGLISSTSVFATLPSRAKQKPDLFLPILGAIILATMAMLLEAIIIVGLASTDFLLRISIPLSAMLVAGLIISIVIGYKIKKREKNDWDASPPLDMKSVLKLALMISTMLLSVSLVNRWIGPRGTEIVSFLGGLFELHGTAFASATMLSQGTLSPQTTMSTIALAVVAAFISKFILLWTLAPRRIAFWGSFSLSIILGIGALFFLLFSSSSL